MIGDFPLQFSIYTNCPLHHVCLAWEACDMGHVTLLVLLDLSAAFDTVYHDILNHGLQSLLGLPGSAIQCFRSHPRGRSQQDTINGALSKKFGPECGMPTCSCLGPLLFTIYAGKLSV